MVVVPGGQFLIGSPEAEAGRYPDEGPQRLITIPTFAVGRSEVTFDQWEACVTRGGCVSQPHPNDEGWGRGTRPVINVSWRDAQEYVAWLSRETGHTYRLLSEAQWEYVARAGSPASFAWGDEAPVCEEGAPNGANFESCSDDRSRPVGSFTEAVNGFGVRDMHGNVWEWVQDCYASTYTDQPADGSAREDPRCGQRVSRGGSWGVEPRDMRAANRYRIDPAFRSLYLGFRVARSLESGSDPQ